MENKIENLVEKIIEKKRSKVDSSEEEREIDGIVWLKSTVGVGCMI